MYFNNTRDATDEWLQAMLVRCAQVLPVAGPPSASRCEEVGAGAYGTAWTGQDHADAMQCLIGIAREWIRRASLRELLDCKFEMHCPRLAVPYLINHFSGSEAEAFVVVFLNAKNKVIAVEEMFKGTLMQTSVHPREVVKRALRLNAGSVVLAHNHPSGSIEVSRADEALTRTLTSALALIDVKVLDHIVVAGERTLSFADRGLL